MESLKKKNYKPEKLFALVIITIFVAEFGLMILLQYLFVPTPPIENLLDATILVIVVYPVLYKYFFKPTLLEIKRRQDAEQRLLQYTKELENITFTLNDEKDRLAKNNAKDEAILESMGEGMVAVDNDRKVMFVNKFATEMLGWNTKELIGKELTHLPLEDEAGNPVPLNKRPTTIALATGNITKVSYFFVRKDKTKFPIAITATPIKLKGEILGLIEIIRDITEEREIDKAKSEFISFASHQLKTPLTAIKFLTERLLTGKMGALAEKQEEYLSDIRSSNQRMINLVNDFLNVSRIELGAFIIQLDKKDACVIVSNILDELRSIISKKQLKLKTLFQENNIVLMLDEPLFRMVINNLIMNAVHYTDEGGELQIECKKVLSGETLGDRLLPEDSFVVSVSDTGYGIRPEDKSKMFTKFFRAQNAREKYADGTGLGLYIVKSILDHSGGSIWFTSRENEGSTFYVAIPISGMRNKENNSALVKDFVGKKSQI